MHAYGKIYVYTYVDTDYIMHIRVYIYLNIFDVYMCVEVCPFISTPLWISKKQNNIIE